MRFAAIVGLLLVVALSAWPRLRRGVFLVFDTVLERVDGLLERGRRRGMGDLPAALLLLLPALSVLAVFGIAPLFGAFYMSLFDRSAGFVGRGNYVQALHDEDFWHSFRVTVYYAFGTVIPAMILSFLVAYLLFRLIRARGLFRTLYFLPYVTSAVAAATVWRAIFNPRFGVANGFLGWLGVAESNWPNWLLEPRGVLNIVSGGYIPPDVGPSLALVIVILFEIWHSSGFMIVIFLAGLTAIPKELEEAARIDGASGRQVVFRVVLPLLSPTLFFLAVVSVIRSFQAFSSVYALTGNGRGPYNTTQNLTIYIYANFYEYQELGYGAAVAFLLCITIVTLTVIQWRFLGRRVHYE